MIISINYPIIIIIEKIRSIDHNLLSKQENNYVICLAEGTYLHCLQVIHP